MTQKGLAPVVIVLVIAALLGGYLVYQNQVKLSQSSKSAGNVQETKQAVSSTVTDLDRRLLINSLPSYIQRYYSDNKKYPDDLYPIVDWLLTHPNSDLQKEGKNLKEDLGSYKYINKGKTYELSVILSDKTILKAPNIDPKETDAMVQVDVNQLAVMINIFYSEEKKYPQTLDELLTLSSFSDLKIPKQPNGEPYIYITDGNSFTISGKLSSGKDYKFESKK